MDLRPDLNDPVVLRDDTGREFRSRVEDLAPGIITVARPLEVRPDEYADAALSVTWGSSRGVVVLPTRIVESRVDGAVPLWSLAVTGPAVVEQQRRFVRVPAMGRVVLEFPAGDGTTASVVGHLADVSEASLRCTMPPASADQLGAEPLSVVATFHFGETDFAIPAHTQMRPRSADRSKLVDVVVVFDEPVRDADALRKQVFAQQLRARRARNDDR